MSDKIEINSFPFTKSKLIEMFAPKDAVNICLTISNAIFTFLENQFEDVKIKSRFKDYNVKLQWRLGVLGRLADMSETLDATIQVNYIKVFGEKLKHNSCTQGYIRKIHLTKEGMSANDITSFIDVLELVLNATLQAIVFYLPNVNNSQLKAEVAFTTIEAVHYAREMASKITGDTGDQGYTVKSFSTKIKIVRECPSTTEL